MVSVLPSNAVYSAPWGVYCHIYGKARVLPAACEESDTGSDSWQTVFNTFGALSIASGLFGMPYAVALRIGANLFGSIYTVLCNKLFDKAHAYFQRTEDVTA